MANSKITLSDGTVLLDLTADTVTKETLVAGITAHDASGDLITGVYEPQDNGIPFEFGGTNPILVAEYEDEFGVADTSFVIGSTSSTSSTSIKASVSNVFTASEISVNDKDVVVVQTIEVAPSYSDGTTNKARFIQSCNTHVTYISKRRTNTTTNNTTRTALGLSSNWFKYYNTSSALTFTNSSYGLYGTPASASASSTTSATPTIRVSSPTLYSRANSSYSSTTNHKLISDFTFYWTVKIYLVDGGSTPVRALFNNGINHIYMSGLSLESE